MQSIHQFLVSLHIIFGALALVIFWIPVFNKKGSSAHIKIGRFYEYSMYVICLSGIVTTTMALFDPIGIYYSDRDFTPEREQEVITYTRNTALFLMMLSFLVLTSVRHGILAVKSKAERAELRHWTHISLIIVLGLLGFSVMFIGVNQMNWLLIIFSGLSCVSAFNLLTYSFKKELKKREWIIEHLGAMSGSGIGVYTAFSAFGGRKMLMAILPEQYLMISWLLPAVIGTIMITIATKKFKKQYRVS